MTYSEWEDKYPNYVVLEKEFDGYKKCYFYNARGYSADVLNILLNYRFYREISTGRAGAGGPDLEKILNALCRERINYIVIFKGNIMDKKSFEGSTFPEGFVNPDNFPEFLEALEQGTGMIRYTEEAKAPYRRVHYIEGDVVQELAGRRVVHHSKGYGEGTIIRAYHVIRPDSRDIYVEIKFDNNRVATPFSLNKCQSGNLLEIK